MGTVDEPAIVVTSPDCPPPERIALADVVIAVEPHREPCSTLFAHYPGLTLVVSRNRSGGLTIVLRDGTGPSRLDSLGTLARLVYAWWAAAETGEPAPDR
jgi:hypothetical protein